MRKKAKKRVPQSEPIVQKPKKRQKKRGPKKRKSPFEETLVGFYLQMEAPLEYRILIDAMGAGKPPTADMIEMVGYASSNPLFKKVKFRKALIEYRKSGLFCRYRKRRKSTPEKELYYMKFRSKHGLMKSGTDKIWDKS